MLSVKHIDACKLSSEAQQNKCNQAIRMFKKGKSRWAIADHLDVHYGTVCNWIGRFETGMQLGKRGRRCGEDRKLTIAQEENLKQIITDKFPDQMKLPIALWTSVVCFCLKKAIYWYLKYLNVRYFKLSIDVV
ncbi:MAG TPA: hypothetical protein DE045_08115 [Oceanospirillaceae bacterium]|nr:hypothetical protein [Oceanospirillaceae bacterium]